MLTDEHEHAMKVWLYSSGYEGNADVEQAVREFAAVIAALDAARGKAEPVAWMYIRKPEEWPPANPVVGLNKWKYDDPARPYWIETPLYAHPPAPDAARGDPVARVVEWQPIETAPTDGTWVQLWGPDGYRGCGRCWRNIDFEDATHWQPIPTGPERGGRSMSNLQRGWSAMTQTLEGVTGLCSRFRENLSHHYKTVRGRGLLVKQIEAKSGYNRRYIQRVVSGQQSNPTLMFVESMAVTLGVTIDDLLK